jgi:hypothetical protein
MADKPRVADDRQGAPAALPAIYLVSSRAGTADDYDAAGRAALALYEDGPDAALPDRIVVERVQIGSMQRVSLRQPLPAGNRGE